MTSLKIYLFLFLVIPFAKANELQKEFIIKVKDKEKFEKDFSDVSKKNLFLNVFVIRNAKDHLAKISKDENTIYIQKNSRSSKRTLAIKEPHALLAPTNYDKSEFRDPLLSNVWSFEDSFLQGMSIYESRRQYGFVAEPKIIVAVIDTGVDYNHPDLSNVMWKNLDEIPNNGIDDDNNGYVDDIHGINTLLRDESGNAHGDMMDAHSHGTHVAGTIGAESNNNIGIAGVASNVKIMGIRAIPNEGDESDLDIAEALLYAANNGAKIINCSFGKRDNPGGDLIPDTIKYLEEMGVFLVVSAGNDLSNNDKIPKYPANFNSPNMIVVASTTKVGTLSYFSNFGQKTVHVAAPGTNIYSTTPNNKYEFMSGTSMAAPAVSGAAAELLSHSPSLTPVQLKSILMQSVVKLNKLNDKTISGGRVDLLRALESLKTQN